MTALSDITESKYHDKMRFKKQNKIFYFNGYLTYQKVFNLQIVIFCPHNNTFKELNETCFNIT